MAENSLGRKLKNGLPIVKMNGDDIVVKAKIVSFESFSAHADSLFLSSFTKSVMQASPKDGRVFIVHGEEMSAACLKLTLMGGPSPNIPDKNIMIPKLGEEIELQ
jgi:metallo-beta-lactamase family protein